VADFLDGRTMILRWLVAFFRCQDVFPDEERENWSLSTDARGGGAPSCVVAHFFPTATTYLAAAEGTDLDQVKTLLEEDLLPERIVGDSPDMHRLDVSIPGLFARADRVVALDVLSFEASPVGPLPSASVLRVAEGKGVPGFRPATRADRSTLEEYARLFSIESGDEVPGDFDSLIDSRLVFVFEQGGKVQGVVRSNLSDGKYVHAGGLYVHPRYRGKGVGRALAAGIGAWVRDHDGAIAILDVDRDNEPAVRAYAAAGYRKVGEGLEVKFPEGFWG
jgi:ribosomal protein S18 acetylase RimI-like enzyme